MPSEMIYGGSGNVDVRVAWGDRDRENVQVATLVKDAPGQTATNRIINIVNEWLVMAGEPPIDLGVLTEKMRRNREKAGELPLDPFFDGWHATLDNWSSVNALIRVLKRARDTSFGRPE